MHLRHLRVDWRLAAAPVVALLAVTVGCGSSGEAGKAAACGDTSATTLAEVRREVFVSCLSSSCHGGGGHEGQLDLATDPHKALINVAPDPKGAATRGWTVPAGLSRVTPNDETKSFLYLKLTLPSVKDPLLGHRMPDTGQTLDECSIQKVRDWIRRGAPND